MVLERELTGPRQNKKSRQFVPEEPDRSGLEATKKDDEIW